MLHDDRFSKSVEEEVGRIEQRTDAEVVVVAAPRSGNYADVAQLAASVLTLLVLIGLLAMPQTIRPFSLVLDLLIVHGLGVWLFSRPWALRFLTSNSRRQEQVERAAAAEFHIEAVHATPRRTGLLVYVSALEKRVELIPDLGLEERIPRGEWAKAVEAFTHDDLDHFLSGLRAIGEVLARHVPPAEGAVVELPDAPRVRS